MEIRLPFTSFLSSYYFRVVTRIQSSAARQSGNFRQMTNGTHRNLIYHLRLPKRLSQYCILIIITSVVNIVHVVFYANPDQERMSY